jgi:hypothetical protein
MKHFVVYHNPEKMGYSTDELTEPCIVTNKAVEGLIGNRIWLIQGKGKTEAIRKGDITECRTRPPIRM